METKEKEVLVHKDFYRGDVKKSTKQPSKLKVQIRNLPPQLTQEQFFAAIEPFKEQINFWYFVPGKIK